MRVWYKNQEFAALFELVADLLRARRPARGSREARRARAYRRAAARIRALDRPLGPIVDAEGLAGVERVAALNRPMASAIRELWETGHFAYLDHLERNATPVLLFSSLPGVGRRLASRLCDELGLSSLEALEEAGREGRLEALPGIGVHRARAIQQAVQRRLSLSGERRVRRVLAELGVGVTTRGQRPTVAVLLTVDNDYLVGVEAGALGAASAVRLDASDGVSQLEETPRPLLRTAYEGWQMTASFSSTDRARQLRTAHDWVEVTFRRAGSEGQVTIVTETHGDLAGRRVVRGREAECRQHYADGAPRILRGDPLDDRRALAESTALLPGFEGLI